jgi:hypothetical protein
LQVESITWASTGSSRKSESANRSSAETNAIRSFQRRFIPVVTFVEFQFPESEHSSADQTPLEQNLYYVYLRMKLARSGTGLYCTLAVGSS